ncbi:MAG: chemotaxis protein CheD [Thermodesulfovibrionales bacterium]
MQVDKRLERITIRPGEYHVSAGPVLITTLLGSCVSACLYDPVRRIVGMNHFLLSNKRYAKDMPFTITEAGRYGMNAMELLINEMMKLGAERANLRAKAFGGGSVLQLADGTDSFFCVGEVNKRFIIDYLKTEGIPLVKADLGGDRGRVIHFNSDDYAVYVRKIKNTVYPQLVQREHQFWENSIERQDRSAAEPDIWL